MFSKIKDGQNTCVYFGLEPDLVNILSASFQPQNGILVVFGPHTVFLHPEGIFSLSCYLVWLSVIFLRRGVRHLRNSGLMH